MRRSVGIERELAERHMERIRHEKNGKNMDEHSTATDFMVPV